MTGTELREAVSHSFKGEPGAVADDAAAEVSRWFSDRAEDLGGPVEVFRTVRVA